MIKILCPTDFSSHAQKALEYAVHLSNLLEAELHVITAYKVLSTTGSMKGMDETIKHNRLLDLKKLVLGVTPLMTSDIPPVVIANKGTAPAVLSNYAHHNDISLVVMGTQGNSSVKNILLGSVTRKVAKKLDVPLLAVPIDAEFNDIKGKPMLLSLDSKQVENENAFNLPVLIAKKLNTKIDVLHIARNTKDILVDPFVIKYIEDCLGEIMIRESHFPLLEINEYIDQNEVGILIMIHRVKGFIENLLLKGFTTEELGLTSVPLMILPEEQR